MRFFRTEHKTSMINGNQVATIDRPKTLPQEAQIFDTKWGVNLIEVTWWIPDSIMPIGGFTNKS